MFKFQYASLLKVVLVLIGLLVVGEGISYFGLHRFAKERLMYHWQTDPKTAVLKLTDGDITNFRKQFFDPDLGWVYGPNTTTVLNIELDKDGSRLNPWPAKNVRIMAYGDHYTFGRDTNPDETWAYYLSKLTNSDVRNFGVMLYSPVQSFLLLKRHLAQGYKPEVVVLSMASESIAPMMGSHRYAYRVDNPGIRNFSIATHFAPTVDIDEGGLNWISSPLREAQKRSDFVTALRNSSRADFWNDYDKTRPKIGFPYLWSTIDTAHYLVFRARRWEQFWTMPSARKRLRGVVDSFVALSKSYKFSPVFFVIPKGLDLHRHQRGETATYSEFLDEIAAEYGDELITVDLVKGPYKPGRLHTKPYIGVLSAYGNELAAKTIMAKLNKPISASK